MLWYFFWNNSPWSANGISTLTAFSAQPTARQAAAVTSAAIIYLLMLLRFFSIIQPSPYHFHRSDAEKCPAAISFMRTGHSLIILSARLCCWIFILRNCSVPSQSRAKIHEKLPAAMGFLPTRLCFLTVSAVNAQTYWTVTIIQNIGFLLTSYSFVKKIP